MPACSYTLYEHIDLPGEVVFAHACKLGCEGIVSKRLGSKYRPGPNKCQMPGLDQGEESGSAGSATRGRRGLGEAR
jgi:hypothetical protein